MLTIDELYDLAKRRRSVRGYDFNEGKDIPREDIEKILEIARWAPSAGNGQPWQFIVIRDREMREKIVELYLKQLEPKREMEFALRGERNISSPGFKNAPVFILVIGDPRVNEAYPVRTREEKGFQHFTTGLANATLLIHLAVAALGMGSQYVSDASSPYMATMLKAYLGIPDYFKIYELIPVGYLKKPISPAPRLELEQLVHYEKFDPKKGRSDEQMKQFIFSITRRGAYGKKDNQRDHQDRA
ncbi:MAG: nitroreductase family protein [Deltaproteobacteria bacterium]|nr:nitroreductase family protein [Deltaproteobacteria bacterium]